MALREPLLEAGRVPRDVPLAQQALAVDDADQPVRADQAEHDRVDADGPLADLRISYVQPHQQPVPRQRVLGQRRVHQPQVEALRGDRVPGDLEPVVHQRQQAVQQLPVVQPRVAGREDAPEGIPFPTQQPVLPPGQKVVAGQAVVVMGQGVMRPVRELRLLQVRGAGAEVARRHPELLAELGGGPGGGRQAQRRVVRVGFGQDEAVAAPGQLLAQHDLVPLAAVVLLYPVPDVLQLACAGEAQVELDRMTDGLD